MSIVSVSVLIIDSIVSNLEQFNTPNAEHSVSTHIVRMFVLLLLWNIKHKKSNGTFDTADTFERPWEIQKIDTVLVDLAFSVSLHLFHSVWLVLSANYFFPTFSNSHNLPHTSLVLLLLLSFAVTGLVHFHWHMFSLECIFSFGCCALATISIQRVIIC